MIKTIDNFLNKEECESFIKLIKNTKEEIKFNNMTFNFNSKIKDPELANKFYKRIIECFEKEEIEKLKITGCNDLVYIAKYNPGENFGLHTDTGLYYDKINKIRTLYTVLIYLNEDFEGGNTVFYKENKEVVTIIPETGKLLMFDINLLHEGKEVLSSNKYWIGIELIGNF